MFELLPILCGLLLASVLSRSYFRWNKFMWMLSVLLIGLATCSVNGELRANWGFLLVDILLVALAMMIGHAARYGVASWRALRVGRL